MAGHLFIVRGDVRRIACDGWLLPSDAALTVEDYWVEDFPDLADLRGSNNCLKVDAPQGEWRSFRLLPWPEEAPPVWVTDMGAWPGTPVEWFIEGVKAFLQRASADVARPRNDRSKPLFALPLVGTGGGGAADIKGEVVDALLGALLEGVREHDADIALVTHAGAAFAAAQDARRTRRQAAELWPELHAGLRQQGVHLAHSASREELVVFMGAGVSREAGLPDWLGLLQRLAEKAGMDESERRAIQRLNVLDQARIVERRLEAHGTPLGKAVAELVDVPHHSLTHALLADLPVRESVTLNYDKLFEAASTAAGHRLAVLPYEPATGASRWLLKMHGCVDYWEDIVLRREDYLRYAERRVALSGIVQSLLITRRMLFVGFSLNDDNFHTIVDSVRKALRRVNHQEGHSPFGTALLLCDEPLLHELWERDLELVAMGDASADPQQAARRLQIFLDFLLSEATSHTQHLLDETYQGVLTPAEQELRDALLEFRRKVSASARETPAWEKVEALLQELGGG